MKIDDDKFDLLIKNIYAIRNITKNKYIKQLADDCTSILTFQATKHFLEELRDDKKEK